MPIAISPGTMNWSYEMPSICLIRPPSESPNTTMNSALERIGASTVCVHSFRTRSHSRPERAIRPRLLTSSSDTPSHTRSAGAGDDDERDGDDVGRAERLPEHHEPGQRGDRRLERHQHTEDAGGDAPQRLQLQRVRD